jgi:S1-C subfamily serine protease/regulation of enolase protein 1 (concanavalin A-like superfamily)
MREVLTALMIGLAATAVGAQESLPIKTVAAIKDATVMIATTDPGDPGSGMSGSGFLFRVDGQTGYIATNDHVVSPPKGLFNNRPAIKVVLRSGTRGERTLPAEVVATSSESDLAIVRITGVKDLPAPIDVARETELVETMPVYVFGFPFGQGLAQGRGRPSVVVGKGSVSSVRRNDDGTLAAVLIDGALNPGNSGGPVVDTQGRLVGVAVAAIRGANIGIAIAPPDLRAMLGGRPQGLNLNPGPARDGSIELAVEVPLFDPLDKLKAVRLLYVLGGPADARPVKGTKEASWEPLPKANLVALKLDEHRGRGSLSIPATTAGFLDLTYQVAFVDGQGRTQHTRPGRYLFSANRTGAAGADTAKVALNPWGDVIDPDRDCTFQVDDRGVSLEVPGSIHDLNAELGKSNAPRIVREVEGDFVAQVKVCGEFQPEAPATREGVLPFNGAGLRLWLDADHCLRIERGAVRRNGRTGAFLLFERHELGRPISRNNAFLEEGDVYLKIERRGSQVSVYYGTDGDQWAEARPMRVDWPSRLNVGLGAVNSASSPLSVRFEAYSVRKLVSQTAR